jgi:hypothetical protein
MVLVDAIPTDARSSPPCWVPDAARDAGHRYEAHTEADLHDGFRLDNACDLLRYANYRISLGDRVRLLTLLEEQGPMPLAVCMQGPAQQRGGITSPQKGCHGGSPSRNRSGSAKSRSVP